MRCALYLIAVAAMPRLVTATLAAQAPLAADAAMHASPGGIAIGTLKKGASLRVGRATDGWTAITITGWIASSRLTTRRDSLNRAVTGRGVAPIRTGSGTRNAQIADASPGAAFARISERDGWTQVRRTVWIRTTGGERSNARATEPRATEQRGAPPRGAAATQPPRAPPPVSTTQQQTTRATPLRIAPDAGERGTVAAGALVEAIARADGWVKVRVEGWIPERDLIVADSATTLQLSAADLRAEPQAHRGKIVRWEVEIISYQRADALRKGLVPDEPFLIARGPADEGAVLYLAVPASLQAAAQGLPALARAVVTARVRDGRSAPVGVPILDLLTLSRTP